MKNYSSLPLPENEEARLASTLSYGILDTENESELDEITELTSKIFDVPIVLITILDEKRQWFKSNVGLSVKETERSVSFCQYTILGNDLMEVENALNDNRFKENPFVINEPNIKFYCGAPLINEQGYKMGSLAIIDKEPKKLTQSQRDTLLLFAKLVSKHFELHVKKKELEIEKNQLEVKIAERTKEIQKALIEIQESDRKLKIANNELSRFIYKITHNFLGPVKTMQGLTNLITLEKPGKNIEDYLYLLKNTQVKLDQSLTSLIKYLAVKKATGYTNIDLNKIINSASEHAKERFPEKDVKLEVEINGNPEFDCNEELLILLLEELFINSIYFNQHKDPLIQLKAWEHPKYTYIQVQDNGIGIPEANTDKIFEMFFRSDLSKSSGLGLYIVKKIIDKLHAKIKVETIKNQGSTFSIYLPKLNIKKQPE